MSVFFYFLIYLAIGLIIAVLVAAVCALFIIAIRAICLWVVWAWEQVSQ